MTDVASSFAIDDLRRRVDALKTHFNAPFDFGHGIVTRSARVQRRFARRLRLLQIPADLTGKSVLDIGAWDGFFSFEFERRGAKRVLAVDSFTWDETRAWPRGFDCFLLAREAFNSNVEYRRIDAHDLDPAAIGTFDLVFCAGVLYHLRHPLYALEKIRSVTAGQLILETHSLIPAVHERVPLMTIFPGDDEGVRDNLKCGFPTKAWVSAALATAGFARHQFVYTPSFRWLKKAAALLTDTPRTGRLIVHAFAN